MAKIVASAVSAKIRSAIKRAVETRFAGKEIVDVIVTRDEDSDGGAIFTVRIVLNDKDNLADFGGEKLSGLIRHLRSDLAKEGETTFPLVRMMRKRDSELLTSEIH
jgi:hypothetical protein